MSSLYITISGSDGGHLGPQNIYSLLQSEDESHSIKVLAIETLPNEVEKNVQRTVEAALGQLQLVEKIYLVGYSMGGAVAAQAAYVLNNKVKNAVKGLVLVATQTDGMQPLQSLDIPVLFYHGKMDQVFPAWQVETLYKKYKGPKMMIEVERLDHSCLLEAQRRSTVYSKALASHLLHSMRDFFASKPTQDFDSKIISAELPVPVMTAYEKFTSFFKRK